MVNLTRVPVLLSLLFLSHITAFPATVLQHDGNPVSSAVFESLEELARIVDITYCVGSSGIQKPFNCLSRCKDFEGFELINAWHTGPLLSDSCGYIALSHEPFEKRIIVAFRGTYSIANTIADLSTNPAEYAPFPSDNNGSVCADGKDRQSPILRHRLEGLLQKRLVSQPACENCTVHSGFLKSWRNARCVVVPKVELALNQYPDYKLVLVGHSLGGAVATLAALEFHARGWQPYVTTFGEPRVGNAELNTYINNCFNLNASSPDDAVFRRVTHVDDPVPLLPLEEWGYTMHAGEIYISKSALPPDREDLRHCTGNADPECIADGGDSSGARQLEIQDSADTEVASDEQLVDMTRWGVPKRYKLWQLFFAHRDYFWRLGLCVPSGYPWDWFNHHEETAIASAAEELDKESELILNVHDDDL